MNAHSSPTHYENGTDPQVIAILENLWPNRILNVNLSFGDPEDGSVTFNTKGYIGRNNGAKPILLLMKNREDWNGMPIATNRILRIATDVGNVLYQHPNYGPPLMIVADDTMRPGGAKVILSQTGNSESSVLFESLEAAQEYVGKYR
jgi:hypothetical protein